MTTQELAVLDGSDGELLSPPRPPAHSPPRLQPPSPAAPPGPAGALVRSSAQAGGGASHASAHAHAYLFASPAWAAALAHVGALSFDAAHPSLAPGCGALGGCAAEEPPELLAPQLLAAVASLALTPCGDAAAHLVDPSGAVDALVTADALAHGAPGAADAAQRVPLAEGAVLLLRHLPMLAPSAEPRRRALLVAPQSIVAAWPAGAPRGPLALPAPRPRQHAEPPPQPVRQQLHFAPPPPQPQPVRPEMPPPPAPAPPLRAVLPPPAPPLAHAHDLSVLDAEDDADLL